MKKNIIERYDIAQNGQLIIKISAKKIEDLYSNYDKASSFSKKDLDDELVEYIIDSVKEIGNSKFSIKFYLDEEVDEMLQNKVRNSINQYFLYLEELEKKKMQEQIKNSFVFMIIGFFFTAVSIYYGDKETIIQQVISEGLMVAGWVSLWEALATLIIKWLPLVKKLKIFRKVMACRVEFEKSVKI
jgi:hypothetical protein